MIKNTKQTRNLAKLLLCLVFLVGCKNEENVDRTIEWIKKAPKPIKVKLHTINGLTMENRYTLIDFKGNVYSTGCVELSFPDTLK